MIEQSEQFLGAVYDLRWILVAIAFAVLVFLWRSAEFDARTLNKLLDMHAEDAEDVADGNIPSRWGR